MVEQSGAEQSKGGQTVTGKLPNNHNRSISISINSIIQHNTIGQRGLGPGVWKEYIINQGTRRKALSLCGAKCDKKNKKNRVCNMVAWTLQKKTLRQRDTMLLIYHTERHEPIANGRCIYFQVYTHTYDICLVVQ